MALENAELLVAIRRQFPETSIDKVQSRDIDQGGSARSYQRLLVSPHPPFIKAGKNTMVLMHYDHSRPDNAHFVPVSKYLASIDAAVPEIYGSDEESCLVWIQDLGEIDLWDHRESPWPEQRSFYKATLDEVAKIHRVKEVKGSVPGVDLQPTFTAGLYRWEQDYFAEHYLPHFTNLSPEEIQVLMEREGMKELARNLARLPRFLVHRDLQSQNVMIFDGKAYLIDYQGLRWGLPEYDLASLLYDPYTDLTDEQRLELLQYYHSNYRPDLPWKRFHQLFLRCAAQRLMQALGAYGNLALNKGMKQYLKFIDPATERLKEILKTGDFLLGLQSSLTPERLRLPAP